MIISKLKVLKFVLDIDVCRELNDWELVELPERKILKQKRSRVIKVEEIQ